MNPKLIAIALCSFLLPIGFVIAGHFGATDDRPVTGTLTYFYAPG